MNVMTKSTGIGASTRRKEDLRLVTGRGCFSDDFRAPGQVHVVFLRSPHAHARLVSIDVSEALALPGVHAVLTGADLLADCVLPLPHHVWALHPADIAIENPDGTPTFTTPHHAVAIDKARHVGEIVAMAVADTVAIAKDAIELVRIDYEVLPSVTNTWDTAEPDAPKVWDDAASNVCLHAEVGDRAATDAAFASAAHVVRLNTWVQRVTGVPMEPRAALAEFDPATGRVTLSAGSGGAVRLKYDLAHMLGMKPEDVRVIMKDIGGNFGTRGMIYPEFALAAWASRRLKMPVKWTCERSESFLSDYQARDLAVKAELALDRDGNFLATRGVNIGNAGAHTSNFSPLQKGVEIMSSIYRMPTAWFRVKPVVSNTAPTRPYRSAGRPEVMFIMERLIDIAAMECGFNRVDLRRRNLLTKPELPYHNPFGMIYDNGDYHAVMEKVLESADWAGFPARREEARARGRLRGIGMANYVDTATGVPRERAEMTVRSDGQVDVVVGTISQGQGHEASFAQLVTEWLGVPVEKVNILTGDTDVVKFGGGTHSGRSMRLGSIVIWNASNEIIAKGRRIAGQMLGVDPAQISFVGSHFCAPGGTSADLFDVARAAVERNDLPEELRAPLLAISDETVNEAAFPYGSHACEVEIDPALGTVEIVRYTTVDDVGCAVNPMIVHGQTHGGIAQGTGQALMEQIVYDRASGQLLTGSFMDYTMPRADCFPFLTRNLRKSPAPPTRSAFGLLARVARHRPWASR
ncbi:MAG: aerobic-type carbon monoxide dehydrogenase, large subunit CoxL/CutL-like protein [Hyphomicrobiales bacterium]|nr:aerobic-type carbon monoxide dehydrogenase, large subunit CoxL/CutL-like protein [Hyphomicrobiales bacterium]